MWAATTFLLFAVISGFYSLTYFCGTDSQEGEPWQLAFRAGMAVFCAFACGSCLGVKHSAYGLPNAGLLSATLDGMMLTGGDVGPERAQKSAHSSTNAGYFFACFKQLTGVEFIFTSGR